MNVAHDRIIDQFAPSVDTGKPLATWYAQGRSDGLGDRLLMFDNTNAPSWELLRFHAALAGDARFAAALRERVECLRTFDHPDFPAVRPISELAAEDGLAVVSTYASGVRLSEALKKPRGAAFAFRVVQQLVPALGALQKHAAGVVHGILDVDRIVMTPDGRLMVREHMIGSALQSLDLSPARLWSQFGILASPWSTTAQVIDPAGDVTQLALVALSLMCGRRIGPDEYPQKTAELLDGIARRCSAPGLLTFQPLRQWLERALGLATPSFGSAEDAQDALVALGLESDRSGDYFGALDPALTDGAAGAADLAPADRARNGRNGPHLVVSNPVIVAESIAASEPAPVVEPDPSGAVSIEGPVASTTWRVRGIRQPLRWAAAAVCVVAAAEAAYIGRLLYTRSHVPPPADSAVLIESSDAGARILVDDRPAGAAPLQLKVGSGSRIRVVPAEAPAVDDQAAVAAAVAGAADRTPVERAPRTAMPAASPSPRSGGFRLISAIPVHVLEGDRVLGSSADGPILATAGRHEFDFINTAIGFKAHQVVDVKAGQVGSLRVDVPNGSVSVNAVPWAAVFIDGSPFGDTPIANLSIAPGEHEIVFRHPQLGERRQKIVVRADGPTRVSASFQR